MTTPRTPVRDFDPSAAAPADAGIFGLPHTVEQAAVVVVPVPYAATTSYGGGAQRGPEAVLAASRQVDLFDVELGRLYEPGIAMLDLPAQVLEWDRVARAAAEPVIAAGGDLSGDPSLPGKLATVNELSGEVNDWVYQTARGLLERGKRVALVERNPAVGGAAVNTGTIPSKTLRETALAIAGVKSRALIGVDVSVRDITPKRQGPPGAGAPHAPGCHPGCAAPRRAAGLWGRRAPSPRTACRGTRGRHRRSPW